MVVGKGCAQDAEGVGEMNTAAAKRLESDTVLYYAKRLSYARDDVEDGHISSLPALKSFIESVLDMVKKEMKLLE